MEDFIQYQIGDEVWDGIRYGEIITFDCHGRPVAQFSDNVMVSLEGEKLLWITPLPESPTERTKRIREEWSDYKKPEPIIDSLKKELKKHAKEMTFSQAKFNIRIDTSYDPKRCHISKDLLASEDASVLSLDCLESDNVFGDDKKNPSRPYETNVPQADWPLLDGDYVKIVSAGDLEYDRFHIGKVIGNDIKFMIDDLNCLWPVNDSTVQPLEIEDLPDKTTIHIRHKQSSLRSYIYTIKNGKPMFMDVQAEDFYKWWIASIPGIDNDIKSRDGDKITIKFT